MSSAKRTGSLTSSTLTPVPNRLRRIMANKHHLFGFCRVSDACCQTNRRERLCPGLARDKHGRDFHTHLNKERQIIDDLIVVNEQDLLVGDFEARALRSELVDRAAGKRILPAPSQLRQTEVRLH